jgi:hypothetical protein
MFDLRKLEINRLIREFEYIKSDYEYKSEIIREADSEFLKGIDTILNKNLELKSIYDEKIDKKIKKSIDRKSEEIHLEDDTIEFEEIPNTEIIRSDKIKKLYREIAKITHPDKIQNKGLNNLYMEASKYYELNDIIGIYSVCDNLSIDYDVEISDIELIKENIKNLKERILFIENNTVWTWINQTDNRDQIILNFIRGQIINSPNI